MPDKKRIIVIGTSAGGMQALCRLVEKLPADLPASIFVVQHLSVDSSTEYLVKRLSQHTRLCCKLAQDLDPILPATIYMAPADRHLLLNDTQVLVVRGPRENQFRPSIDPLFRSAAGYHSAGVIGVILTGFMSDGVGGMESIARSGGLTVVQDPEDAEYPQLPQNVMRQVTSDYVVPLHEMAAILTRLVQKPVPNGVAVPTDIWQEVQIVERIMRNSTMTSIQDLENLGNRSPYSCPDCGGGLWEVSTPGNISRFRCHSGHAYTQDMLLLGMSNSLEETLWVAMRTLEERRNILLNLSKSEATRNNKRWISLQEERAEEMKVHIERLRELLTKSALSDEEHLGEAM